MRQVSLVHDEGFDRFWAIYPKHVAKKDALKAWEKLRPSPALIERILAAVEWQRQTPKWLKDGGEFAPYPATWLRSERWEDEPCDTRPLLGKQSGRLASALANIAREAQS